MKRSIFIKQAVFTTVMVAGLNIFSSCESCNRKENDTETMAPSESGAANDTYSNDTVMGAQDSGSANGNGYNSGSGQQVGSGNAGENDNASSSGSSSSSSSGSNSPSGTTSGKTSNYDPNNDPIENTSSPARNSKGEPINSGGSSGSGSGTGSGSTGNNSRVSKAEDQKG